MKLLNADTVRRCFIADHGKVIISADFDQIELRVAAALSGETVMIDAAKRNESLHKVTAVELFGVGYTPDQYRYTKNVNFGWLFGGGPKTLAEQAGITFDQAKMIIKTYEAKFPQLAKYKKHMQEQVIKSALTAEQLRTYYALRSRMFSFRYDTPEGRHASAAIRTEIGRLLWHKVGYVVTPFNRRLPVDADRAYSATNYAVQSTARDIMADALLRVMADPELAPTVLLIIHDEILGQAWKSTAEYIAKRYGEVMYAELNGVPLTATGSVYGKSWGHGYRKK